MPTNRAHHISTEIEEIKWLHPNSILDVGIGWGIMGVCFRAFTDIQASCVNKSRYHNWETRIDGIEIFEWYRSPCWNFYTNIYIGNALEVIDTLEKYDVIYCGDMIEHLTKEDGYKLIDKMLAHCNMWVQIATPSPAPKQEQILDNPNEVHLSSWVMEDFNKYKCELVGIFKDIGSDMLCVRLKT